MIRVVTIVPLIAFLLFSTHVNLPADAADWPMWRYDEGRRAVTPAVLADRLHLQWVRELPPPDRAWPFQFDDADKLAFDESYEPVAAGGLLFVASMVTDSVTAYDAASGEELWRFHTNGPVRFAPAVWEGKVYAGSDDGYLYCLNAADGRMLWRFLGGPTERWLLGNERLINMWAVRGAPVIREGTLYFAAGVWPFMGIFVYALDAGTGEVIWANTGSGSMYNLHQHGGAYAYGGVAPQGYIVATEDKIIVPGGRTVPAVFDRATGELLYFEQSSDMVGKGAGGYRAWYQGNWFFNHGPPVHRHSNFMYTLEDGAQLNTLSAEVVSEAHLIGMEDKELVAYNPEPELTNPEPMEHRRRGRLREHYSLVELWRTEMPIDLKEVHLQAGNRLYASGPEGLVAAIDLPQGGQEARIAWQPRVDGEIWRMLAANGSLFVVTLEGSIYCFGPEQRTAVKHTLTVADRPAVADQWSEHVRQILDKTGITSGYALVPGVGSGRLIEELLSQSDLRVIAVESDAIKVEAMRIRLSEAGMYGKRAAVVQADPAKMNLAPYMASLIVSEEPIDGDLALVKKIFETLRPYGGTAWFPLTSTDEATRFSQVRQAELPNAVVETVDGSVVMTREGPLDGAGSWTHQYSDPANTNFSPDQLARAPLGVLWFGGENNHNLLPRHMNGPIPQVSGGRIVLLGRNTISARDSYTGRQMWIVDLPGVGEPFTSADHEDDWLTGAMIYFPNHPGANYIGSPYVSKPDGIYIAYGEVCLRLNPETGEKVSEFQLPKGDASEEAVQWGHIIIWEDLLIAGADPQYFDDKPVGRSESWNATSSGQIVVMNRHTGEVLWSQNAHYGFRHNAIIAGNGRIFAIDGLSAQALEMKERRGAAWDQPPKVMAFDARTGRQLWSLDGVTFGTWLSYSVEQDIVVQSGRHGARGALPDEPRERMVAHRGADGSVIWERAESYSGPIGLRGNMIISGRGQPAIDLLTGKNHIRIHPLTDEVIPWSFNRTYGCGTQNLSEHLITFRSGAAGFYDLSGDGGTGNLGGFRSGCTNNLVAGDGLLCAPDYTRSCTCSYQLQTSLALVHMPEMEMWTYVNFSRGEDRIRRVGVNLGAPGSRTGDDGLLWLDHPKAGGTTPDIPINVSAESVDWFHYHAALVESGNLPWVAASGIEGAAAISLNLGPVPPSEEEGGDGANPAEDVGEKLYTVRLHFSDPTESVPGSRLFNVALQGQEVLSRLDIAGEAGGARRAVVKEFAGVAVGDELRIELVPNSGKPPILSGVEVWMNDPSNRMISTDSSGSAEDQT